ncbi:ethanolamine utilization protein EutM [Fusobacterium animalis 11_3_2]|uniref:Ethanolamine utilization protein EutM n=1 Tax=Fusobacterium animalis 11_3_2 TaxID=457403 RepID=F7L3C0_9FUSO|nr:BMC domain-containing protein [Fusobacterium animalis]EGN65032.1 ethanolamine utilization protein EutM [Fusobacterium animalis 11_3_2]
MKALGLIETRGMVGAIVAADIALKTAQVELINKEYTKGGLVCIEFEGDVAAVKASVEAAVMAIKDMGVLIASHVIPRPDDSVEKIIKRKVEPSMEEVTQKKVEETKKEIKDIKEKSLENVELKDIQEEIEEINEILKVSKNKKQKIKNKNFKIKKER